MAKKLTTAQVVKLMTCPSCGLGKGTGQHCGACGYMFELPEDQQPVKTVEETDVDEK